MDKNKFEKIKKLHGEYASWAIWSAQDEKPKSNIGDLSLLDVNKNSKLLSLLKPNVVLVALNFSRGAVREPFANFHDSNPRGTDFKIRYALQDTPYWGAYMTDIIKNYTEKHSQKLMSYLNKNKYFEKENVVKFLKELKDLEVSNPTIIAFGNDAYNVLVRNEIKFKILKIPHYAHQVSKEKYREAVQSILNFK